MQALIEAADAARRELRSDTLPNGLPATKRLAKAIGDLLHQKGFKQFDTAFWQSVLDKLGTHIEEETDVYFWVCGFSQNVWELMRWHPEEGAISEEHAGMENVQEGEVIEMVTRVCDAIVPKGY